MFLIEFHTYQNQKKITKEFPSVNKEHVLSIKQTLLKNVHVYLIQINKKLPRGQYVKSLLRLSNFYQHQSKVFMCLLIKLPRGQYVKSSDFLISININ